MTKRYFRARLRKSSQNFYSILYELTVPSIPSLFIASPSVSSSEEGHVDVHSSASLAAFITSLSGSLDWYLAFFAAFPLALSWVIHGVSRKLLSTLFVTVVTEESVLLFQARSTFWKTLCKHSIRTINFVIRTLSEDRRACEFPFSGVSRVTGQS